VRGGDVEKDELVGSFGIIGPSLFDRVPGVAQGHELDPFDHAAGLDVQTGNESFG
jgi:hypothetical protein